jgi:hypothetical protein
MIRGSLFTRFFLEDGIRETPAYRELDPNLAANFAAAAGRFWAALETMRRPSEAETEAEFIFPVLELLGWQHLPQQGRFRSCGVRKRPASAGATVRATSSSAGWRRSRPGSRRRRWWDEGKSSAVSEPIPQPPPARGGGFYTNGPRH